MWSVTWHLYSWRRNGEIVPDFSVKISFVTSARQKHTLNKASRLHLWTFRTAGVQNLSVHHHPARPPGELVEVLSRRKSKSVASPMNKLLLCINRQNHKTQSKGSLSLLRWHRILPYLSQIRTHHRGRSACAIGGPYCFKTISRKRYIRKLRKKQCVPLERRR